MRAPNGADGAERGHPHPKHPSPPDRPHKALTCNIVTREGRAAETEPLTPHTAPARICPDHARRGITGQVNIQAHLWLLSEDPPKTAPPSGALTRIYPHLDGRPGSDHVRPAPTGDAPTGDGSVPAKPHGITAVDHAVSHRTQLIEFRALLDKGPDLAGRHHRSVTPR